MKKNNILIIFITLLSVSLYARQGSDITINSSYIIPIENSDFNSSLVVGVGADFWGIFEFTGNVYFEIDPSQDYFFDKFQEPNVFSVGVGVNIPMGGFYLKSDYQRFFNVQSQSQELSISNYTDSYKLGIGINLNRDVEMEFYYRSLIDSSNFIENGSQGFIGMGLNIAL